MECLKLREDEREMKEAKEERDGLVKN